MQKKVSIAATWRYFDFWLIGAVALLVIFGITMIRSAVAGNVELVELNLVQRQLIFTLAGTALMLVVAAIDYRLWASISRPIYVGTIILLATLTIVGRAITARSRDAERPVRPVSRLRNSRTKGATRSKPISP